MECSMWDTGWGMFLRSPSLERESRIGQRREWNWDAGEPKPKPTPQGVQPCGSSPEWIRMGTHGSDPYLGYHLFLSCCTFMHAGCTCQRSRSFQIGSYFPPRLPHFHFYFCCLLNVWRVYDIIFVITLGLWFYIRASFGICYGEGNDLALFREDLTFGCVSTPCVCLGRRRMAPHIVGKVSPLSWRPDTNHHPGVEKLQYIKARWLSLTSCVDDTKHFPDGGSPGA